MFSERIFPVMLPNVHLDFRVTNHPTWLVAVSTLVHSFGPENHDQSLHFRNFVFNVLDKVASFEYKPLLILRFLVLAEAVHRLYGFLASF